MSQDEAWKLLDQVLTHKSFPFQIEHSGQVWTSLGIGPSGRHIWPIEELFARRKFKATVKARIKRLNPNGKEEGCFVRGWHPNSQRQIGWWNDQLTRGQVISQHGREILKKLKSHGNGKRGAYAAQEVREQIEGTK